MIGRLLQVCTVFGLEIFGGTLSLLSKYKSVFLKEHSSAYNSSVISKCEMMIYLQTSIPYAYIHITTGCLQLLKDCYKFHLKGYPENKQMLSLYFLSTFLNLPLLVVHKRHCSAQKLSKTHANIL